MRRFCFAVLAGTAAAVSTLFTEAQAAGNKIFSAVDCSEQMNKEREPMGFPKFTVLDTSTPITGEDKVNTTNLCANIKEGTDPGVWLTKTSAGLSIAAARQSSAQGDCAAATKQWKGALKTIGDSLPPAYTPGQDIYKSLDVVSLMSLYTPKDGVAVACTVIQCPPKSSTGGASDSGGSNTDTENGQPPTTTPTPPKVPEENEDGDDEGAPSDTVAGGAGAGGDGGVQGGDGKTKEGKELKKANVEESPPPVTASAVTAGVGGVPPAPATAAAAAEAGVRGGMTLRRLDDSAGGEESFNALVCLFKPETLTEGAAPFQESEWKTVLENGAAFSSSSPFLLAAVVVLGLLLH